MAKSDGTISRREYARQENDEKYPLLVRIYGVLGIIAGCVQVGAFVMATLAVFFGNVDFSSLDGRTTTTLVIGLVAIVLSVTLAVMEYVAVS